MSKFANGLGNRIGAYGGFLMRGSRLLILAFVFSVSGSTVFAQDPAPFSAERPGFTNGVGTVAPGYFQLEYGYRYSHDGGSTTHQLGEGGQIRAPLKEYSEVRFGLPAYFSQRGANGFGDSSLSLKYRFRDADVGHFGLATIFGTTLPTSPSGVGDSFWKPFISLEFSQPLNERWELQASGSYTRAGREHRFDQTAVALNLGYNADDRTSVFVETYRFVAGEGIKDATYIDGGVTFMANRSTQFDINGGFGVSSDVRKDYFLGFGVARRW